MAFAAVNGIQLYYEVHGPAIGEAPVLVFAHGAGGNHISWWQQIPHFSRTRTCVTFDQRGYGQSLDTNSLGGGAYGADLAGLVDHLGVSEFDLVAQSMGGWTALAFALKHPGRIRRLVMADTNGGLRVPEPQMAVRTSVPPGSHPATGPWMEDEQPALAFLYKQLMALSRDRQPGELMMHLNAIGAPSVDEIQTLTFPVLFIIGENDLSIPPVRLEAAARAFPNATVALVPKSGHSVYFERPARFNELVEAFLA
jgi:3-oxoadipate enol-lactonase